MAQTPKAPRKPRAKRPAVDWFYGVAVPPVPSEGRFANREHVVEQFRCVLQVVQNAYDAMKTGRDAGESHIYPLAVAVLQAFPVDYANALIEAIRIMREREAEAQQFWKAIEDRKQSSQRIAAYMAEHGGGEVIQFPMVKAG